MDLIQHNPYRIAGILSNASERQLQRQKAKIKAFVRVGKEINSDYDFQILRKISRTEDSVIKAFSQVEQNRDKLDHALFWFLNTSPFDNTAIEYLKKGNEKKAIEIWKKVTTGKDINSKNFSAFNNLGTYQLLSKIKSDIKKGIEAKIRLIESDFFEDFVHSVADQTITIDNQKQAKRLIDRLFSEFNNLYAESETMQLFSECNESTQQYISDKFTEGPLHNIESQIERCKKKRKEKRSDAYSSGLRLYENTRKKLFFLKSILGISDLKYKAVADQLANEVMQCGIDYFNELKNNQNPSKKSLQLLNNARAIALSTLILERIQENINGIKEWAETAPIQKDLTLISNKLNAFQNSTDSISNALLLITSCKSSLQNISEILGVNDDYYLNISSAIASNSLGMIIQVVNSEQEALAIRPAYYRSIDSLKGTVKEAIVATQLIRHLDMHSQARNHFNQNHEALINLENQIFNATASSTEKIGRKAGKLFNKLFNKS